MNTEKQTPSIHIEPSHWYLSGPMSGLQDHNFPEFCKWAAVLRDLGYDIINPAEYDEAETSDPEAWKIGWEACLRRDLGLLVCRCEGVFVLKDWRDSIGATLEVFVASTLNLPVKCAYTREDIDTGEILAAFVNLMCDHPRIATLYPDHFATARPIIRGPDQDPRGEGRTLTFFKKSFKRP